MFTNNIKSHALALTFGKDSSVNCTFTIANFLNEKWGSYDTICGSSICNLMKSHIIETPVPGSRSYYGGVIFGDGTTKPTVDDYKLAGNVISDFVSTHTITMNSDASTGTTSITKTYTITNTGTSAITIAEVALIDSFKNGSWYQPFIIDRTVLDNPVTIAPGEVGQVVYTLSAGLAA